MPSIREILEAEAAKEFGDTAPEKIETEGAAPETHGKEQGEVLSAEPERKEPEKTERKSISPHENVRKQKGAANAQDKAPEQSEAKDTKATETEKPEQKGAKQTNDEDAAPGFLSPAAQAQWASLNPILRREIKKYERDGATNAQSLNEKLKTLEPEYNEWSRVTAPYKDRFARQGMTMPQVFNQLMALVQQADQDFPGFVREQARMRNFDLTQLVVEPGIQVDPKVSQLENQLRQIQSQLYGQQQAQVQSQQQVVQSQIEQFQNATDESGNPKHPYFENVKKAMGALMQIDPNMTLDQAYDRAVYADPEIRALVLTDQRAKDEEKRRAESIRLQNAAKSSAGRPSGVPAGALPPGSNIRAHLLRAMEMAEGSARV